MAMKVAAMHQGDAEADGAALLAADAVTFAAAHAGR